MKNALNSIGEVYLTVGANRSRTGKIQIKIQGALRELEALTDYNEDLKQGKNTFLTKTRLKTRKLKLYFKNVENYPSFIFFFRKLAQYHKKKFLKA